MRICNDQRTYLKNNRSNQRGLLRHFALSFLAIVNTSIIKMSTIRRESPMLEQGKRRHLGIWIQTTITEEVCKGRQSGVLEFTPLPLVWSTCVSDPTTLAEEVVQEFFDFQEGRVAGRPKL